MNMAFPVDRIGPGGSQPHTMDRTGASLLSPMKRNGIEQIDMTLNFPLFIYLL